MGAFVAALSRDDTLVCRRAVRHMLDLRPYRQLSEQDVWAEGPVTLGYSDLQTDHRVGDAQPFSLDGRIHLVMDGRLDDREALGRRLERQVGRAFSTSSDVELVANAYQVWGRRALGELLGDFAFCLWDAARHQLFCARDHFGVKPLYYARVGGTLVVSNVLRSVRRYPGVSARLNDAAVGDFLLFGVSLTPQDSSFADIARVPPAHALTSSPDGALCVERYWTLQPGDEVRLRDPTEYVHRFSHVLDMAVRDRLRGGRVGILMSGGLDSSSVAAAASSLLGSRAASSRLRAFTTVYDTVVTDRERHYSSIAAQALGIPVEHVPLDSYRLFDRWHRDALPPEPSSEPMTAAMADLLERMSRHGAVGLTGDGGDPILLPSDVWSQIGRVPVRTLARDLRDLAFSAWRLPPLGLRAALRRRFQRDASTMPSWLAESFLRRFDATARWQTVGAVRVAADRLRGRALSDVVDPWWASMFECHDPGATQRTVELRYPFFDVRLVSLALTLPSIPWCVNKEVLRRAMFGRLPDPVRLRPKAPLVSAAAATHGRWTVEQAVEAIAAVPAMMQYVDVEKFRSAARLDGLLVEAPPGTLTAVALALWLRADDSTGAGA